MVISLLVGGGLGDLPNRSFAQGCLRPSLSWTHFEPAKAPPVTSGLLLLGEEVYLYNCVACHGEGGQGNGWRAHMLFPKPRDFTRGIFRFKSTESGSLPTDSDLFRTVSVGVQGTAMPAWMYYLSEQERWGVVAHVKTFSKFFAEEAPGRPIPLGPEHETTPASMERGKQVFQKVGCADCHGSQGFGDGRASRDMMDSFGYPITPRNFHNAAEFKRGHTLRDIALTVSTGNDGTPMPSFKGSLTEDQIWALASFVMSLEEEQPFIRRPCCPMGGPMGQQGGG